MSLDTKLAKIKIRYPDGSTETASFPETDTLADLQVHIMTTKDMESFLLSTTAPRKIYQPEEFQNVTLEAAGLSPSGLLIVQHGIQTDVKISKEALLSPGVQHPNSVQAYNKLVGTPNKLVVVDFSAEWCGPCKAVAPHYESLALQNPGVVFVKVDVDQLPDVCQGVSSIPEFRFYKNGKQVHQFVGGDVQQLKDTVAKHK